MDEIYEFTCKPIVCSFNSENYKAYGADIDLKQFPFLKLNKYDNVSIVGNFHPLGIGIEYQVKAKEENNKYGVSYKVINIRREKPTTTDTARIFLNEILTGDQTNVLLNAYPDIINMVIEDRLEAIDLNKLHNIKEYRFNVIKNKIIENFALVDLIDEFQGLLDISILKKIYAKYASVMKIRAELKNNPYKCLCGLNGIGFKTADSIILEIDNVSQTNIKNGEPPILDFGYEVKSSLQREKACIMFLLENNEKNGNTYMDIKELKLQADKLTPLCKEHFVNVIKFDDDIHFERGSLKVSLSSTYDVEKYIAETIFSILKNNNSWDLNFQKYIKDFNLTGEQGGALEYLCKYNLFILNGYGGSGKSFTTSSIIPMLKENKKSYYLFAPTGRASKVLCKYTKSPASTIHRGLAYMPPDWGYNENNKLIVDVVIVDETSMVDIFLFEKLLKAIDITKTKIMFVGDAEQIPSVGAGNILHDMINSKVIPIITLNKIFRYGIGGVLTAATKIRLGEKYIFDNKMLHLGEDKGYIYLPFRQHEILRNLKALYKKLIGKGENPKDILILTAYNKGDYGTININNLIQPLANKNYGSKNKVSCGDINYFLGDLVIQCVNNYKAKIHNNNEIFLEYEEVTLIPNGEIGEIVEIQNGNIIIQFDTERVIYNKEDILNLKLAYSISIHKSQGGQCKNIILINPKSHTFMLNSNLLYVGVTRAEEKCYHIITADVLNLAMKKKENFDRKTFLKELLL